MNTTIHFLDKAICFCDKKPSNIDEGRMLEINSNDELHQIIENMKLNGLKERLYLFGEDIRNVFDKFLSEFKIILAAGGIVRNKDNDLLMIYRNNCWDLPKGKLEKNEDLETAAIREVKEECGIREDLKIIKHVQITYHYYKLHDEHIIKKTFWYEMACTYEGKLIPQKEEGIIKVEWVPQKEVTERTAGSYASIKEVLKK